MSSAFLDLYPDSIDLTPRARVAFSWFVTRRAAGPYAGLDHVGRALDVARRIVAGEQPEEVVVEEVLEACYDNMPDMDDVEADEALLWVTEACISTLTSIDEPEAALNAAAESLAALFAQTHPDLPELEQIAESSLPPDVRAEFQAHLKILRGLRGADDTSINGDYLQRLL